MGQSNKSGERNPNNPPNPRKGQSMVPYNPELKYTQDDFKRFQVQARRQARECLLLELGISDLCAVSTPSSRWFVEHAGEDSFPGLINQERGSLCMGKYTDDEIANGVFMHGDMPEHEKHRALLSGNPSSIAWLTAAKERIRWLSRHLESSLSREEHLTKELAAHNEKEVIPQAGTVTKFNPSADFNTSLQMALVMLQGTPEQQQEALQFLGGLVGKITLKENSNVPSD